MEEQKGILVSQHKRMAMGVPLTGQTQANAKEAKVQPKQGGLSHTKKK
jgi:hypothetical protein